MVIILNNYWSFNFVWSTIPEVIIKQSLDTFYDFSEGFGSESIKWFILDNARLFITVIFPVGVKILFDQFKIIYFFISWILGK